MIFDEDAIISLIPNTEWHYRAGVLKVFTKGVVAPTAEEISAEKIRLEQAKEQAEAEAKAQKQAILDRLGLTEEELRIVLGQGIIL